MNGSWRSKIAISLLLISLLSQTPAVRGQTAAHLTISITGQNLTAGFNSTVIVTVLNNWVGYASVYNAIYDVDIAVSLPAPLTMYGDNHWHFDSIQYGQTVTLRFLVFAPAVVSSSTSAIANSFAGSITATYKQLGDLTYTSESHVLTMALSGWVNLIVYGVLSTPSIIPPGGNTTISGNLLNGGNLAGYNANITVISEAVSPDYPASVYIGEIDPNIPRPFSLLVIFKPNLPVGNFTLTIRVTAIDQSHPGTPFIGQQSTRIQVSRPQQTSESQRQRGPTGPVAIVLEILRYVYDVFFGSTVMHAVGILLNNR